MGYRMRVYSRSEKVIPFERIEKFFEGDEVALELTGGKRGSEWGQFLLNHPDGRHITLVNLERATSKRSNGARYLKDDIESARERQPAVNAEWVVEFLLGVKNIYSFQILDGVYQDDGWDYVRELQHLIRDDFDGILYAELEGYSNQDGMHLTWEFSENVTGKWNMALYDPKSQKWTTFTMQLGNRAHRAAFRAGQVPKGAEVFEY
jgi:hypothetical protein